MSLCLVIPVKDEEKSIANLLDSLKSQTLLPDRTVIVNAGSTDNTSGIIKSYQVMIPGLELLEIGPAFPGKARNAGVKKVLACCQYIAFTDGGIVLEKDWLFNLMRCMEENPGSGAVFGDFEPVCDTFFKKCNSAAYVPARDKRTKVRGQFIASCLIKKEVFSQAGLFREDLRSAEDLLFVRKMNEAGFVSTFMPSALVYWNISPDAAGTFRRFRLYARYNIKAGLSGKWQVPVLRTYTILLLLIIAGSLYGPLFYWAALLLMYARVIKRILCNGMYGRLFDIRFQMVLFLAIQVIDAATLAGSIDWLLIDKLRWRGKNVRDMRPGEFSPAGK